MFLLQHFDLDLNHMRELSPRMRWVSSHQDPTKATSSRPKPTKSNNSLIASMTARFDSCQAPCNHSFSPSVLENTKITLIIFFTHEQRLTKIIKILKTRNQSKNCTCGSLKREQEVTDESIKCYMHFCLEHTGLKTNKQNSLNARAERRVAEGAHSEPASLSNTPPPGKDRIANNRRFPKITGEDNLTVFSYSRRVKSPEWRRPRRRADLRQF